MSTIDKNCSYLISTEKSTTVQQEDICKDLESSEMSNKIKYDTSVLTISPFFRGLQNSIIGLLAGEPMPRVLMTVIR
jgi:hypothetical protein